jgi:hypothetical protein
VGKIGAWNSPCYGASMKHLIIYAMRRIDVKRIRRINTMSPWHQYHFAWKPESSWLRTCTARTPETLGGNKKLMFDNRSLVMQRPENRFHLSYHVYSVLQHKPSTRSKYSVNFSCNFNDVAPKIKTKPKKACLL